MQHNLKSALSKFLNQVTLDSQIVALFQRVRVMQNNGVQIHEAIKRACNTEHEEIRVSKKTLNLHADNASAFLAIRYRAKLIEYRSQNYGYGTISKMLAQKGVFNRSTKKAYSRSTIKRAIELIESSKKMKS